VDYGFFIYQKFPVMDDQKEMLDNLLRQLNNLEEKQSYFNKEINTLRFEIQLLKSKTTQEPVVQLSQPQTGSTTTKEIKPAQPAIIATEPQSNAQPIDPDWYKKRPPLSRPKTDMEKFIGENLINKIGIGITVIGVAIGAKYSIEHDLINPLTRIILGYLFGIGLLLVGLRLKKNFESYSAVLVSGAMAIMYFITFAAYSFYDLIPLVMAFFLMVLFTAFTVVAALNYNNQVIALIGLVGAYAVPFLLSTGSGEVRILFGYMVIINIGILIISFRKYWKPVFYTSLTLTWMIYGLWYFDDYEASEHLGLALFFEALFFLTFYITFLAYKLLKKESFQKADIILLIINSFVFYGFGYGILDNHAQGEQFLGLFTLANGLLHFIVSVVVFRQKMSDKSLFYYIAGLVLVFVTLTIPVQLDGKWVTLMWAGEAILLFWIGRTKGLGFYELLSYPLMALTFVSLLQDWSEVYSEYSYFTDDQAAKFIPVFNVHFLESLLVIAAFGFIIWFNQRHKPEKPILSERLSNLVRIIVPVMFIIILYNSIRLEISNYWDQLYYSSAIEVDSGQGFSNTINNQDLRDFESIWIINYSLLFLSVGLILIMKKLNNPILGTINLVLNGLMVFFFLSGGLLVLSNLRDSYLTGATDENFHHGIFNLVIRYISLIFVMVNLAVSYFYIRKASFEKDIRILFTAFFHIAIVWILSSELINWLEIAGSDQTYKLGLSILWGIYSLALIGYGIWKNVQHLRIMAIILFGGTLVKLFVYDVANLETIPKTILFVSLGILLLIISYLYNKYKHIITNENKR
jgi:uncharacterized membrane protein